MSLNGRTDINSYECIVIGAGPAGLAAATYLGRFRRSVLVIDGGESRTFGIPQTNNLMGFTAGISGKELLLRMREQAAKFGAEMLQGEVTSLVMRADSSFEVTSGNNVVSAQTVVLATGGLDVEPRLADIEQAVLAGLVRYCPICDAYEAQGKRIALISYGSCRTKEALLLRAYTSDLTVLTHGQDMEISEEDRRTLSDAGIAVQMVPIAGFSREGAMIAGWFEGVHEPEYFDIVYCALGTKTRSQLAVSLGVQADEDGYLIVDRHQRTHIPGLYAAGDVVRGLSQITVAAAQGAIAATDINARLPQLRY